MLKHQELSDPRSCLSRARETEMVFVLLGRDVAAAAAVRFWINERIRLGKNAVGEPQITEAENVARVMDEQARIVHWPRNGVAIRGRQYTYRLVKLDRLMEYLGARHDLAVLPTTETDSVYLSMDPETELIIDVLASGARWVRTDGEWAVFEIEVAEKAAL